MRGSAAAAMKIGWIQMGVFWNAKAPWAVRRLALAMKVQSNALSAMTAFVLRPRELRRLDRQMEKFLRAALQGASPEWRADSHPRRWPAAALWRKWQLAPCAVELRVQRLRWLQAMIAHPEALAQLVAVVFGRARFDPRPPPLEAPTDDQAHRDPWLRQLLEDVGALADCDEGDFGGVCRDAEADVAQLFHPGYLREVFLATDATYLRAVYLRGGAANAGPAEAMPPEEPEAVPPMADRPHTCELPDATGAVCGRRFKTLSWLRTHQRFSQGGEHGRLALLGHLVVSSQCPLCSSVLACRRTTIHHLLRGVGQGRCLSIDLECHTS